MGWVQGTTFMHLPRAIDVYVKAENAGDVESLSECFAPDLLELGPRAGARLVMPRLGEPVEPTHAEAVAPWWRVVDTVVEPAAREPEPDTPAATTLPKAMPWPID
jgi:hypothetical protein